MSTEFFCSIWTRSCATAIALSISAHTYALSVSTESHATLPPVSIFSSYSSDAVIAPCQESSQANACVEDYLSPRGFYDALTNAESFVKTAASEDGFDYEILVANVLIPSHNAQTDTDFFTMVTEFDVTWRSVPLASYKFEYGLAQTLSADEKLQFTQRLGNAFMDKARAEGVFDADYLFSHLNASNYLKDLQLPQSIDAFTLDDLQLYHDPLRGAVARYTHPEYPKDIIDVFVYPVFDPMANSSNSEPLAKELEKDINDISLIAQSREIDEIRISDIQAIDWQIDRENYQGKYFDVAAVDDSGEPLFTTTYVFQSKDKIIKFSANFPGRVATHMIKDALPKISVPEPSQLMQSLRQHPQG
ncbi:hypothetical protein [Alteromonas facilis]|uniref:hypothetical protein n=1 Tax=Alteromonas facilis TaxID=2048004 RepID=UPI000C29068B|nr:hypothetical protein [Alteromonas facilis]